MWVSEAFQNRYFRSQVVSQLFVEFAQIDGLDSYESADISRILKKYQNGLLCCLGRAAYGMKSSINGGEAPPPNLALSDEIANYLVIFRPLRQP